MKIILLGPTGAGKGTQAKFISDKYVIPHISTGDMMRDEITTGSPLGLKAKEIMDAGTLMPDEIIIPVVTKRLEGLDCKNGFVLDGFPRTLAQAQALTQARITFDTIIQLNVSDNEIQKRLLNRKRADDKPENIQKRLAVYKVQTTPVLAYYQALPGGITCIFNGERLPEAIFTDIALWIETSKPSPTFLNAYKNPPRPNPSIPQTYAAIKPSTDF